MRAAGCPLCDTPGGHLVFTAEKFRVIRADEAGFPAFYRVVWSDHVPEFTDLSAADRALCMEAVAAVEEVMRSQLAPDKVNVAALGNVVAHLHWHVIARFKWDSHFPAPVWAQAQRPVDSARTQHVASGLAALERILHDVLESGPGKRTAA